MAEKKMTYKEALRRAKEVVTDVEVLDRLTDLEATIDKKASAKSAKKRVDNSALEVKVREILASGSKTPTELGLAMGLTTQKVSAVARGMADVTASKNGKHTVYTLASAEEVEDTAEE